MSVIGLVQSHYQFWTDPTDFRIWISLKIQIQIPDYFCFKFWHWRRFALSECSCYFLCCVCLSLKHDLQKCVFRFWWNMVFI